MFKHSVVWDEPDPDPRFSLDPPELYGGLSLAPQSSDVYSGDWSRRRDSGFEKEGSPWSGPLRYSNFELTDSHPQSPQDYIPVEESSLPPSPPPKRRFKSLGDKIDENKDSSDHNVKYNLEYPTTQTEMMHADRVAYSANGDRHIYDMMMDIYEYILDPNTGLYKKKGIEDVTVYGAHNAKILARTNRASVATDITLNADNFAQYALAKYVQGKIGGYPWLPIVDGEAIGIVSPKRSAMVLTNGSKWGVASDVYRAGLQGGGEDLTFTISGDGATALGEENTLKPLTDLEWTSDDKYPSEYINELKEWANKAQGAEPAPPAEEPSKPAADLSCNGVKTLKYMSVSTLAENIKTFCKDAVSQGVQDQNSGSIFRNYNHGSLDDVNIAVDWPSGVKIPFDEAECNSRLKAISANCDGNNPDNPMDWKAGGTNTVTTKGSDLTVKYRVDAKAWRQALPNKPGGFCDVQWKAAFDEFWIWGNGYATSDWGQKNGGLLQNLKDCDGLTGWTFDYGIGDDGREWSAHGRLLIGKAWCVEKAIEKAGGPSGVDCSGDN